MLENVGSADALGQALPERRGPGEKPGNGGGVARGGAGQRLAGKAQEPRHQRGQGGAANGKGGVFVQQQRGQVFQHIRRADGHDRVIGDGSGIAIACAHAGGVGVNKRDLVALGQKRLGHGKADNARADDSDFGGDVLGHPGPAKARRSPFRRSSPEGGGEECRNGDDERWFRGRL